MMYFAYKSIPLSFVDKCKSLFTKKNEYMIKLVSIKSDTKHCIFGYYISKDRGLVCEWSDIENEDWVFIPLKTKSIKEYYQNHKGSKIDQVSFVKEALGLTEDITTDDELIEYFTNQ